VTCILGRVIETVRIRSFALVLALVVGSAPAVSLVCEMDCAHPPAASTLCHETVPGDGSTLRAVHICDHDQAGGGPALLTSATGRDSAGSSFAAAPLTVAASVVPEAPLVTGAPMYGPPGPGGRSTSSRVTVLRI
jgi:hypothetical protein